MTQTLMLLLLMLTSVQCERTSKVEERLRWLVNVTGTVDLCPFLAAKLQHCFLFVPLLSATNSNLFQTVTSGNLRTAKDQSIYCDVVFQLNSSTNDVFSQFSNK